VRDHEPSVALVAPGDAFSVYRRLAPQAARVLAPGGRLLLEIGMGMEAGVRRICEDAGLGVERVLADLRFIPRTLVVRGNPAH
jgi:release factor glutamine methyltransferase